MLTINFNAFEGPAARHPLIGVKGGDDK